jgi:hypothetical protein
MILLIGLVVGSLYGFLCAELIPVLHAQTPPTPFTQLTVSSLPVVPLIPGLSVDSCDATQVTFSASKKDCPHLRYTTKGTTATDWHITYRCSQT